MNEIKNTNLIPPSPQIDINTLKPFTRFCCSIGIIPASYLVAMSYEEQLLWLCDFLENTVIPTVNNNAEAVAELQGLFIELKNYVDNYFTNLDVQEEINKKLDIMAEDGTLEKILLNYTSVQKVYLTFKDLLNDKNNLLDNMKLKTYGFNNFNDLGAADYFVSSNSSLNGYKIDLKNSLFIYFVPHNFLRPEQFGAIGDGVTDDTDAILSASSLNLPLLCEKNYLISKSISLSNSLFGCGSFIFNTDYIEFNVTGNNFIIEGLTFNFNNKSGRFIHLNNCEDLTVNNCKFLNCR